MEIKGELKRFESYLRIKIKYQSYLLNYIADQQISTATTTPTTTTTTTTTTNTTTARKVEYITRSLSNIPKPEKNPNTMTYEQ